MNYVPRRSRSFLTQLIIGAVGMRYDFSWFEATLECGRVHASESCSNHEKGLIRLVDILKGITESQYNWKRDGEREESSQRQDRKAFWDQLVSLTTLTRFR